MKWLLMFVVLALPGCAAMYGIPTMPSIDLAKAVASSDAACVSFPTPWGVGTAVTLTSEKGVIHNGKIKAQCGTATLELTNDTPVKP